MKSLIFVFLLAVTVTAKFPLKQLLANPKLFVSAFAHADNDAIVKMRDLISQLLNEGEDARNAAQQFHDEKTATHDADVEALNTADNALTVASENLNVAVSARDVLVTTEATDRESKSAALRTLGQATELDTTTYNHELSTTARVAEEKEMLDNIIVLLESVKSEAGRRLLSIDTADPGAVDAIISKVNDLLAAGESEVTEAINAHNAAHAIMEDAGEAFYAASDKHTESSGQLAVAEESVTTLTSVKSAKRSEKEAAVSAEDISSRALAAALKNMEEEVARVDSEKAILEEADGLLEGLLA